jgi:hypothetical protein
MILSTRDAAVGLLLGVTLVAAHLLILFGSVYVPGSPMNEALRITGAMAGQPTDAEIQAWFENAGAVVFFSTLVVPLIVALIAGALRVLRKARTARGWVLAIAIWLAFFLLFQGIGGREAGGAAVFLAVFGLFEYFARKRDAGAAAAA